MNRVLWAIGASMVIDTAGSLPDCMLGSFGSLQGKNCDELDSKRTSPAHSWWNCLLVPEQQGNSSTEQDAHQDSRDNFWDAMSYFLREY